MYENLLQLPYFQGMSKDEITAILDKVTIEFFSYNDGETICRIGEECDKFIIVTKGKVLSRAIDARDHYTYRHSQNVAYYAAELAKAAGMEQDLQEIARESGLLHDIQSLVCKSSLR